MFLINSLEGGGAERVMSLLLAELAREGHRATLGTVELWLLDDVARCYAVPESVAVRVIDAKGSLLRSLWGVVRWTRRERPAVVLSFLTRANVAAVAAKLVNGVACVVSERVNTTRHFGGGGWHARLSRRLVRFSYPRADRVIAVSEGVARDLVANFGVARHRTVVIHNPYDLDALERLAHQPPAVPLPAAFVVTVGRLTANKNVRLLLEAYRDSGIAEDLVILGTGALLDELTQLAAALGVRERVHFLGFVANPYAIVARARAFVSTSDAEGFPNGAAEAMALGRPVAMTDCPSGPGELLGGTAPPGAGVVEGAYGLLMPVGDRRAAAAAFRRIVSPPMAAYAERGRRRMQAFRLEKIARAYRALVDEVRARRDATATSTGG